MVVEQVNGDGAVRELFVPDGGCVFETCVDECQGRIRDDGCRAERLGNRSQDYEYQRIKTAAAQESGDLIADGRK